MHRLRRCHRTLLAVLLVAGIIGGCTKEEEIEEEGLAVAVGGQIEPCIPVSVRLWGEPAHYSYEGTAGQIIDLSVTSQTPGLDPNVRLFDPSEKEEAFDDDSGGKGDALLQKRLLGSSGTYTVTIGTDEDRLGEVSVLLQHGGCVEGTMETPEPMGTDLPTAEPSGAKD